MSKKSDLISLAVSANLGTEEELSNNTIKELEAIINPMSVDDKPPEPKAKPKPKKNLNITTIEDLVTSGRIKPSTRK